jgi:murein DD-endopeptidase MepM/ murein hydrolase activator NlpD
MTDPRPRLTRRLLIPGLGVLALAAPASSLAGEPAGTTTAVAPAAETSSPPPAPEVPTVSTSGETAPGQPPASPGAPVAGAPPQVRGQLSQGSSPSGSARKRHASAKPGAAGAESSGAPAGSGEGASTTGAGAKQLPPSPLSLTPSLPQGLESLIAGVPSFFIESFAIPPFLLPIFQAAGTAYGIPWQVLAAINEIETDYGRDLSVSTAGAEGWMQFLPSEWAQYGVDANGDGYEDPYNPADAIFAAARYLRAAGGETNIKAAVYSYNHSQEYVESVMLRAQLLGGTPPELLGAITGLTEARFPVHAAAHFSDGFPTVTPSGSSASQTLVGTTIYAQAGAPVVAVQDGEIVQIGNSPSLGRFVSLRDAYGNTYTYAQLGDVAALYPVLVPRLHSALSSRISGTGKSGSPAERAPSAPATAGAQPRSPVSAGAVVSGLALGAAAGLEPTSPAPHPPLARPKRRPSAVRAFREGSEDVYLHPLRAGVQVIAGTILGHVGADTATVTGEGAPHIVFQIRPAGAGAPLIDPKPILDGWVALENTSIFRARGENPFLATSPTVGQVLLESKQQLEPQVLHDPGIRLGACGREAVESGKVDRRVLATLEYLSVSGLKPAVSGLRCAGSSAAAAASNSPAGDDSEALDITAVNGIPIAGHQGPGSIADTTVRKLLMLQGVNRPQRVLSLMSYQGVAGALASPSARDAIELAFRPPGAAVAHGAAVADTVLKPSEWIELVARLGEIPDPTVADAPSPAAIPDNSGPSAGKESGGND